MIAKKHHKQWLEKLTHIELDMTEELYMPIMTQAEGEITLHQTLMLLRSKKNYECTILQAINKHAVTGTITALCHSGYKEEANKVMMNLVMLCNNPSSSLFEKGIPIIIRTTLER